MKRQVQGVGLGLRPAHYKAIYEQEPGTVPWFEVLADNFIIGDGMPRTQLHRITEAHPVVFHSVGMSLGSPTKIDRSYLVALKRLGEEVGALWYSDHLCFTELDGVYINDLLPLPFTEEAVGVVSRRIRETQELLESRILIENVSQYLHYKSSSLKEWEFLRAVSEEADCDLLLDLNNIYVNSVNQTFDPLEYLRHLPRERIKQFHLAGFGFARSQSYLIDTHGASVADPVWELYKEALRCFGDVPTLIEWDNHLPPFDTLLAEKSKADRMRDLVLQEPRHVASPHQEVAYGL